MANNFSYITREFPKVVDEIFTQKSLTDVFLGSENKHVPIKFDGAKRVGIFKVASTGLGQYKRGGHGAENTRGAASSDYEYFTLGQERYSEIPVDKLDTLDDAETVLGYLAGYFVKRHVVQEFDAYRFSKLASYTSKFIGNRKEGNIAENTIIKEFNDALKWFEDNKVPSEDQIIYVSTSVMKQIRNTTELVKYLSQKEYTEKVDFKLYDYAGRTIIEVPEDEFYTNLVCDDNGYHPTKDSKIINFLAVDKSVPVAVKRLDYAKIFDSTDDNGSYLGFVGYLFTNLYYHDIFVSDNGRAGVYCSVSDVPATGIANKAVCDFKAGSLSNTVLTYVNTKPQGIKYDKIYLNKTASVPTIGATASSLGYTEIFLGQNFTPDGTNNIIVLADDNKVVAVSENFLKTLPKGA